MDVFLLIVDKPNSAIELPHKEYIHYIYLEDLKIEPDLLLEMAFKYTIIEMNTAVKPAFILYLLHKGYKNVIYLDPDMMCFNSFKYIEDTLLQYEVMLTPHRINPITSNLLDDSLILNNGLYNLGFLAVRNTQAVQEVLSWWNEKLKNQAFLDYAKGLATDQIWANFFPLYFRNVYITRHSGMNVAYWNIEERIISKKGDLFFVNNDELLFFHFSGFSLSNEVYLKNGIKIADYSFLNELYNTYKQGVLAHNYPYYAHINYGFACYTNGVLILPCFRRLYIELKQYTIFNRDPFSTEKKSFYYYFVKMKGRTVILRTSNCDNKKKIFIVLLKVFILVFGIKNLLGIVKKVSALSIKKIARLYHG